MNKTKLPKIDLEELKKFKEDNRKERLKFSDLWSKYVLEHNDKDWSRQKNRIINSCPRSSFITKELYLRMKGEER